MQQLFFWEVHTHAKKTRLERHKRFSRSEMLSQVRLFLDCPQQMEGDCKPCGFSSLALLKEDLKSSLRGFVCVLNILSLSSSGLFCLTSWS